MTTAVVTVAFSLVCLLATYFGWRRARFALAHKYGEAFKLKQARKKQNKVAARARRKSLDAAKRIKRSMSGSNLSVAQSAPPIQRAQTAPHIITSVVDSKPASFRISVSGMTCAVCTSAVENAVNSVSGVASVSVSLITESAEVTMLPGGSIQQVVDTICDCGMSRNCC